MIASEWHPNRRFETGELARATGRAAVLTMSVLCAMLVLTGCGGSTAVRGQCAPNCSGETSPSWSPDGRQLAFASDHDGESEIYVVTRRGGRVRKLTDNGAEDSWPSWSPDGRRIAFVSDRGDRAELFVMNKDGSDQRRLTTTAVGEVYAQPAWSPDGHRLAFDVWEGCEPEPGQFPLAQGGGVCTTQMYVVGADGSGQRPFGSANDYDPAWSRTGLLAFGSDEGLVVERAGKRRLLLRAGGPPASPSWSPDSRWIVYDNGGELEITRPDGTGWRVLTPYHFPRENTEPAWSPDGRTIAFSRMVPGTEPIYSPRPASTYLLRPDGSGLRRLRLDWQ